MRLPSLCPLNLIDEPTTGLDPRSRSRVWELVRELAADGVTVLLTTQYLEEADQLADRIAVLDGGVIVASGTAAQLKSRVGAARLDVRFADGTAHSVPIDGTLGSLHDELGVLRADTRTVTDIDLRSPTLDDAFLALTGRHMSAADGDRHGARSARGDGTTEGRP